MRNKDPRCPLNYNDPCRHCSDEEKISIQLVGDLKTNKLVHHLCRIPLGKFCNNDGRHFVKDMKECPVPAALAVPLVPYQVSEREWFARRIQ